MPNDVIILVGLVLIYLPSIFLVITKIKNLGNTVCDLQSNIREQKYIIQNLTSQISMMVPNATNLTQAEKDMADELGVSYSRFERHKKVLQEELGKI
jgi:uncharacterized protein YoxC